jgi:hypothetical protein
MLSLRLEQEEKANRKAIAASIQSRKAVELTFMNMGLAQRYGVFILG